MGLVRCGASGCIWGFGRQIMHLSEQFTTRPRNAWTKLRAVLDLIDHGDLDMAERVLSGLTYHPNLTDEILAIYAGHLQRAQASADLPRKINLPSDYLANKAGKLLPPLRRLPSERAVPKPYPPHMILPDFVGSRNDATFLDEAAAALSPRGYTARIRVHVVYTPTSADQTEQMITGLDRQDFDGPLDITVFAGIGASDARRELRQGGTCQILGKNILSDEGGELVRQIAEKCDLVLFLNGMVEMDDLALLRLAYRAGVTDTLVQPLIDFAPKGVMGTAFVAPKREQRFSGRYPFRDTIGLNMAVPAALLRHVGPPEIRFADTAHAGRELAFRLYNVGAYFAPQAVGALSGVADPKSVPEDAELYRALCPNSWDRKKDGRYENPKVSVYIPCYNASKYIERAIDSVLDQDVADLDVCLANDGSPDNTLALLERRYGDNPRVRWVDRRNGGIGFASNQAIRISNSLYIGQLDSDDALKPGAVRRLMEYLDEHPEVACCYSSCERIDAGGKFLQNEYSWPVFSREKMMVTSIAHHFRMFRRNAWERTSRFRQDIVNAVDYDIFLKLSETGEFHHIDEVLYQRRWHGENTSNVNEHHQTSNTYRVQRETLKRLGMANLWDVHAPDHNEPRRVTYKLNDDAGMVLFWPDYSYSNPYQKLLYRDLRNRAEVLAADIDTAISLIERGDRPDPITFHLHWLNFVFNDVYSEGEAQKAANAFVAKLEKFIWKGGRLVWTIHNTVSHDTMYAEVEANLSERIAAMAHVLHFHSQASVDEVAQSFDFGRDKVRISRHGNYVGCYQDFVDGTQARRALGIDQKDDVMLFAGQLRRYKGVEQLIASFRRILADRPRALLVLAGAQSFDPLEGIEPALSEFERSRIRVVNRFLDNSELQLFFHAADASVYPYRNILTSGSMLMALSFGAPVVIPEVGMTHDVLSGRDAGVLYDKDGGKDALEAALRIVLSRKDKGELPQMRTDARARAQELDWPDFTDTING